MLYRYVEALSGFIRDRGQKTWNPADLVRYTNRARREIAMRTQCIRRVPPISAPIEEIHVINPGSGYTAPVVTISGPDLPNGQLPNPNGRQATAVASVVAGQISNVSVSDGGDGYFLPSATIADPTGSGAVLQVVTAPKNTLNQGQERYNFADFPLGIFPGVKAVIAVLDVALLYNNLRYRLFQYSFSEYQAYIRNFPFQYTYVPVCYTQFQAGTDGSLLLYPFPSQTYAWEPDCLCIPEDLQNDQDFEAIGEPFTESVPYLAAAYAMEEAQSYNNARYWHMRYAESATRYSNYARPRMLGSPYGRR